MPLLNSIGPFLFLDLAGGVEQLKTIVELEQRPGVDGTEFRTLGLKGEPFELRSKCDAFTVFNAQAAFYDYCQLIGQGVYPLIQYGTDYTLFGVGFMVKNVVPVKICARLLTIGGLFPPSLGWIEASWTLVPVRWL